MEMKHLPLRIATGLAAAMTTLGVVAAPAMAAPVVDSSHAVTLSIHKHLGTLGTPVKADGTVKTVGLPTLNGVNFDVYKVYTDSTKTIPVDLTTNEGWQTASEISASTLTPAQITSGFTAGAHTYYVKLVQTVTTASGGLATFAPTSGIGLYFVKENLDTSGTITSGSTVIPKNQISPSAPFFVTLPMTNPAGTDWMYDVNVYPKNQQDTVSKTVVDQGTQAGDTTEAGAKHRVVYTITSSITDGMDASTMGSYVITDKLDSRLTYVSAVVKVGTTTLTAGPSADYTVSTASGNVVITMTDAGRAELVTANNADPNAKVVTTITADITGGEGSTGIISNQASVIPNQAWKDANPSSDGIPSDKALSKYGDLIVTKYDAQDTAHTVAMTGAKFAVFVAPTGATSCTKDDVSDLTKAVATGTVTGNTATIKGLQTSDWYNGTTQTDLIHYCLVETQAPQGYNLNAQPISFTILDGGAVLATTSQTVYNAKANLGNQLPLTGGTGIVALSVAGVALVGGGVLLYVLINRRRAREEA
jgi:fimbrial isopeptide formation D2 family protein/LPXTG-motif cell wall-anchored protein